MRKPKKTDTPQPPVEPAPRKGRTGRPSKLTPELVERIAQVVRVGNYLDTAARYAGVDKVTLYAWMKKGHAQKRGPFRDFLNAMEQAQAQADVRDHALIAKASEKDWRAAVEHLKLRNQARYNAKRVEVSGPDGSPVQVESSASAGLFDLFVKLAGREDEGAAAPPVAPPPTPEGES